MALTKVTGQVIKNTTDVTVGVLTVTNTLAVGGTVSIGGTLTYEDVTNVDAVGLITARNGIVVGSGITLSKDGDVFFTGIATGNGSGLTALNASNIGSGTVPTARLGSGTASSSTFLRGDSTFQTVNTDLVSDTSPQLGGDLASNSNDILMAANDRIVFGTDKLRVKHTDSNADIENTTGNIVIKNDSSSTSEQIILQAKGGEDSIKAIADGAVELYHNDSKKFETTSAGVTVTGHLTVGTATLYSTGNLLLGDSDEIRFGDGEDLKIYHSGGTNYCDIASGQQLYFRVAGSNKFYVQSGGAQFVGSLYGDDSNKIELGSSQDLKLYHNGTDSYIDNATGNLAIRTTGATHISLKTNDENAIYCGANGAVQLYYDNSKKLETTTTGVTAGGPNLSQTAVVGAQAGFFGGAKSSYASATGLIQNQVCILDTTTSAAAGTGGALTFAGYIDNDSTTFYATIEGVKENSSTNNYGGNLKFLTRTHSAANMKQAMLINSAGNLYIHSSDSSGSNGRIYTNGVVGGNHTTLEINNNTGSGTELITFRNSGSQIGQITQSGSGVAYGTSSDYRLKENDVAISDGITRIKQLRPIRFNFKTDTDTTLDGFFAHEVQSIVPESVKGEKDAVFTAEEAGIGSDVEGGIKSQTLDQSKLVPLLTAALQEAITKIETLETKVAALEG